MPQQFYRGNLSAANYPMTIGDGGRTVIIPGPDQNFDRRVDPAGEQKDAGIPQALFMENVLPTYNGYQSVGLIAPLAGMTVPPGETLVRVVEVKAKLTLVGPVVPDYITDIPIFLWSGGTVTAGIMGQNTVIVTGTAIGSPYASYYSVAVIRGICYFYSYNPAAAATLYTVTFSGTLDFQDITASVTPVNFFTSNEIRSLCGSNNYLIAQNDTTTFYSSTTTTTDFVSSLVSGAGQINPNNSDDAILFIKETTNGFYLYCINNVLYAQYTGNARYPWKFTPVINSTGLVNNTPVTVYGGIDTPGHFVVESNNQIKIIQGNTASAQAPELSDFLANGKVIDTFDYASNTFDVAVHRTQAPNIYLYLNRYILVSVNGTSDLSPASKFTHVVIYDIVLNRYGRIKHDHSYFFTVTKNRNFINPVGEYIALVNIQDNTIRYLNLNIYLNETLNSATYLPMQGMLLLGKFQYVRSRMIKMEGVEIEGPTNKVLTPTPNFSCVLFPSLDGRNFDTPIPGYLAYNEGGVAKYSYHATAQNHSVGIKGAFSVNTVQLNFTPAGKSGR